MEDPINTIPPLVKEAIDTWATGEQYWPPGSFVRAVLENDLRMAVAHADPFSRATLSAIVTYCEEALPSGSWGSPEKARAWMEQAKKQVGEAS